MKSTSPYFFNCRWLLISNIFYLILSSSFPTLLGFSEMNKISSKSSKETRLQFLNRVIPVRVQNTLRDLGFCKLVFDGGATVTGLQLAVNQPDIRKDFLEISQKLQKFQYGPHPRQYIELLDFWNPNQSTPSEDYLIEESDQPLCLFIHGGAWGSGKTWMYRLITRGFSACGFRTAVLGYRVYPQANVQQQVDDLNLALEWVSENKDLIGIGNNGFYLAGHSSGAHIISMYILQQSLQSKGQLVDIQACFLLCGVYDIYKHYLHEAKRGVHEISPMKPAAEDFERFQDFSPTLVAENLTSKQATRIPPMMLIHAEQDEVVPMTSSLEFHQALESAGAKSYLKIVDGDHVFPINEIMFPDILGSRRSTIHDMLLFLSTSFTKEANDNISI